MNLVVPRDAPSIRVVDEAAVSHLARIVARERHRASHEPHAVPPRRLPEELLDRPGAVLLLRGHLVRVAHAENAEILGEHDELRSLACGPRNELRGGGKILLDSRCRHHLHHGGLECSGRAHGSDGCCVGSAPRTSALRRSATGFSQVPVTRYSNVRAWPNGLRRRRSEEHTSELQSPCNLVCRLLLEKKKNNSHSHHLLTRASHASRITGGDAFTPNQQSSSAAPRSSHQLDPIALV